MRPSQIFRAWNPHVRSHLAIVAASLADARRIVAHGSTATQRRGYNEWLSRMKRY